MDAQELPTFSSFPQTTNTRYQLLTEYCTEAGLSAEPFSCTSYEPMCKPSHHSEHFYPGQLHHIGRHYDLVRNAKPFRLVIVGQDAGSTARVDLDSRRRDILATGTHYRFRKERGHPSRNRHMRGTTNLLRLIFGKGLGSDYGGEFLLVGDEMVHLFECFSLVNFLLCSALATGLESRQGARSSRPTREMYEQCGRHFRKAIEILEPTHIIVQGPVVREWIGRHWAVSGKEFELPRAPVFPAFTWRAVDKIRIKDKTAELLSFYHPSARAGADYGNNEATPYLVNIVQPTIESALKHRSAGVEEPLTKINKENG